MLEEETKYFYNSRNTNCFFDLYTFELEICFLAFLRLPKNCITAHNNIMLQTDFKCETCFGKGKLSSYRKNQSKNTNRPMA